LGLLTEEAQAFKEKGQLTKPETRIRGGKRIQNKSNKNKTKQNKTKQIKKQKKNKAKQQWV
jgi:hypothetical protein